MSKKIYGSKEVCERANISARQLGYWKLIGIIRPRQELHGSKVFHLYTEQDIDLLKAVQKLTEEGYRVNRAADKIKSALARGEALSARELVKLVEPPGSEAREKQDALEGLDAFRKRLAEEESRSRRFGYPFSCLAVRVDVLTPCGGEAVRRVIQEVERRLAACKRAYEAVAKGEPNEFLWLLCQTPEPGARLMAARIRKMMSEQEFLIDGVRYSVRIRIGTATLDPAVEEVTDWVERARRASDIDG